MHYPSSTNQPQLDHLQRQWLHRLTDSTARPLVHQPTQTRFHILGSWSFSPLTPYLVQQSLEHFKPSYLGVWYRPEQIACFEQQLMPAYRQQTRTQRWWSDRSAMQVLARRLVRQSSSVLDWRPMLALGLPLLAELLPLQHFQRPTVFPLCPSLLDTSHSSSSSTSSSQNFASQNFTSQNFSSGSSTAVQLETTDAWPSRLQDWGRKMDEWLVPILYRQLVSKQLAWTYDTRGIYIDSVLIQRLQSDPEGLKWWLRFQHQLMIVSPQEALALDQLSERWQRYQASQIRGWVQAAVQRLLCQVEELPQQQPSNWVLVVPAPYALRLEQTLARRLSSSR